MFGCPPEESWTLQGSVILLHGNARPHTAQRTGRFHWEVWEHTLCSPDLTLTVSDYLCVQFPPGPMGLEPILPITVGPVSSTARLGD